MPRKMFARLPAGVLIFCLSSCSAAPPKPPDPAPDPWAPALEAAARFHAARQDALENWGEIRHPLLEKWIPNTRLFRRIRKHRPEGVSWGVSLLTKDWDVTDLGGFLNAHTLLPGALRDARARTDEDRIELGQICVFILRQYAEAKEAAEDPSKFRGELQRRDSVPYVHFCHFLSFGDLDVGFDPEGRIADVRGYRDV